MPSAFHLGVEVLDHLTTPPPAGTSWVLAHQPGLDAKPLLHETLRARLAQGGRVLYVCFDRHPSAVSQSLRKAGIDVDTSRANGLVFVDGYSRSAGSFARERLVIDGPRDGDRLAGILEREVDADTLVIIESLSAMADRATSFASLALDVRRIQRATRSGYGLLALFTRWPYGLPADALLETFDAVIGVGGYYGSAAFGQFVELERASWSEGAPARKVSIRAVPEHGVLEYIPKIVVTGPFHAGKSTFVASVCDTSTNASSLGTTVVADHGQIVVDGITADLFGTPGQERFDPLLRTLAGQAMGVVLVVDSTDPSSFPRAREMLKLTRSKGIPALVVANKQDQPGALRPAEVALQLGVPPDVAVRGCVANDRANALSAIRALLTAVRQPAVIP